MTLVRGRGHHYQPESSDLQMMSLKSDDVFNNNEKIDCFSCFMFFFSFLIKVLLTCDMKVLQCPKFVVKKNFTTYKLFIVR